MISAVKPDFFRDPIWQMSLGERAALLGLLSQLEPDVAIEIGSMEGACLRQIAGYARDVHSFDLNPPSLAVPDNVTLHTGDSHELLPAVLAELHERGRNVDFVMVDGDHTPEGVRRDIQDLLDSPAVGRTIILIHDTTNERVRQGVDAVRFLAWPKVAHVELDWIPGRLFAEPRLHNELWYGLGLVIVDSTRLSHNAPPVYEPRYHPTAPLLAQARSLVVARERLEGGVPDAGADGVTLRQRFAEQGLELAQARRRAEAAEADAELLRERIERADRILDDVKSSASWKLTRPLRAAKREATRLRAD